MKKTYHYTITFVTSEEVAVEQMAEYIGDTSKPVLQIFGQLKEVTEDAEWYTGTNGLPLTRQSYQEWLDDFNKKS